VYYGDVSCNCPCHVVCRSKNDAYMVHMYKTKDIKSDPPSAETSLHQQCRYDHSLRNMSRDSPCRIMIKLSCPDMARQLHEDT